MVQQHFAYATVAIRGPLVRAFDNLVGLVDYERMTICEHSIRPRLKKPYSGVKKPGQPDVIRTQVSKIFPPTPPEAFIQSWRQTFMRTRYQVAVEGTIFQFSL